ncbi:MAG: hypothetical protein FGM54_08600 [Chitinophagaceae bacterium]|nr:hypothetical protein [Chitinophagaceae bacterium]
MTIKLNSKLLIRLSILIIIISSIIVYRNEIIFIFKPKYEKVAENAINYLIDETNKSIVPSEIFNEEFSTQLLYKFPYTKIYEWKLKNKLVIDNEATIVYTIYSMNKMGMKLEKEIKLILNKKKDKWLLSDSYNLFSFDMIDEKYVVYKSDLQKSNISQTLSDKIKVDSWYFEETYGNSVKGKAIISNNAEIPVSFIKLKIEYKDNTGAIVNTDETYVNSFEALYPGEKKSVEWYTTSCYSCYKGNVYLVFK